ncbi:hypothetical protein KCU62_g463, partial [Aureobasidium sp. EXF-3399]
MQTAAHDEDPTRPLSLTWSSPDTPKESIERTAFLWTTFCFSRLLCLLIAEDRQILGNIVHYHSYTRSNLCTRRENIGSRMTSILFEFASISGVIVHFYS